MNLAQSPPPPMGPCSVCGQTEVLHVMLGCLGCMSGLLRLDCQDLHRCPRTAHHLGGLENWGSRSTAPSGLSAFTGIWRLSASNVADRSTSTRRATTRELVSPRSWPWRRRGSQVGVVTAAPLPWASDRGVLGSLRAAAHGAGAWRVLRDEEFGTDRGWVNLELVDGHVMTVPKRKRTPEGIGGARGGWKSVGLRLTPRWDEAGVSVYEELGLAGNYETPESLDHLGLLQVQCEARALENRDLVPIAARSGWHSTEAYVQELVRYLKKLHELVPKPHSRVRVDQLGRRVRRVGVRD